MCDKQNSIRYTSSRHVFASEVDVVLSFRDRDPFGDVVIVVFVLCLRVFWFGPSFTIARVLTIRLSIK